MDERNKNKTVLSVANMELIARNKSLEANGYKTLDSPCSIRIHSLRHKLADPDGISGKAAIDGLVRAGILKDDSTQNIKEVSFSQEKIKGSDQEETIIIIG